MKILFIYMRYTKKVNFVPPLGIAYIASMLEKNGHAVNIMDYAFFSDNELEEKVKMLKPDVIGFSTDSISYGNLRHYVNIVKNASPNSLIIAGGPHPTMFPELTINEASVDIVVIGEGELSTVELLDCIQNKKDFSALDGIVYKDKKNDKIVIIPKTKYIEDLDILPYPARHLLDIKKYLNTTPDIPMGLRTMVIYGSRGCNGNCIYCQPVLRNLFGKKMRFRSPEKIVDEIEHLMDKYKTKNFYFADDEFLFNTHEWIEQLCHEIKKRNLKINWQCQARIDHAQRDILKIMKEAGCFSINFGVESGSQKILNYMRKGYRAEKILNAFKICQELKIITTANFMFGTPNESKETLNETFEIIKQAKPDFMRVSITTPTPGSDLYKELVNSDRINIKSWEDFNRWVINPIKLENLTQEEIKEFIDAIFSYYKKNFLLNLLNPYMFFFKKRYFYFVVIKRFFNLFSKPKLLFKDIMFYLNYTSLRTEKKV